MTERCCSVEGCDRSHLARGLCATHYSRWRAHGDVLAHVPVKPYRRRPRPEQALQALPEETAQAAVKAARARGEDPGRLVARAVRREVAAPSCQRCERAPARSWSRRTLCPSCSAVVAASNGR